MSEDAGPDRSRARRALSFALRAAVSVLLVVVLVWKIPLAEVGGALQHVPLTGVLLGVLVTAAQVVTGTLRWKRMLALAGEDQPLSALLSDVLIASAYNLVLPSSVGGDVIRALRCAKRLSNPHAAWSTTLFERMIGLPTLAVVAAPGIALVPGGAPLVLPTLAFAIVTVLVLLFVDAPVAALARFLTARAPAAAAVTEGIVRDLRGPLGTPAARLEAFAWSLAYQALGISILAACVVPLLDRQLLLAIYAGLPIIVVASMIPISIAGFGVRESLFVVVLGRLGVPEATALALSVLWLGSYVVLAGPGVLLVLRGDRTGDVNRAI